MPRTVNPAARACLGFAALALLASASGCRRPVYTFNIGTTFSAAFPQHRVLRNGHPIDVFQASHASQFTITGPRFGSANKIIQSLSVQALTPCGWHPDSAAFTPYPEKRVYGLEVTEATDGWDTVNLMVDNRSGGPASLAVGAVEQPVPAHQYAQLSFSISRLCPQADQLALNGRVIIPSFSRLDASRKDKDSEAVILIDTTASHCYAYQWAAYGTSSFDPVPGPTHGSQTLTAGHAHLLDQFVDYVFQPLPDKIQTLGPEIYTKRVSLTDRACAG